MRSLEWYIRKWGDREGPLKFQQAKHRLFLRECAIDDYVECLECGGKYKRLQHTHFLKCSGGCRTIDEYKSKYPDAVLVSPHCAKKSTPTLDGMILKYGVELGNQKWEEYCLKQAYSNSYEYKHQKYGWSYEDWVEHNKSRAITKELCIIRHGEDAGLDVWNQYVAKQATNGNTIEWFIAKYGEAVGTEKYNHVNFLKTHCEETFKLRYGDNWLEEYDKWLNRFNGRSSNLAEQFISDLVMHIGDSDNMKYSPKTNEWFLRDSGRIFYYDFVDLASRKIIEVHGDYWHANPRIYDSNFFNTQMGKTFAEIHEYDAIKLRCAAKYNFEVLVIWEYDIRDDRTAALYRAINWINNYGI